MTRRSNYFSAVAASIAAVVVVGCGSGDRGAVLQTPIFRTAEPQLPATATPFPMTAPVRTTRDMEEQFASWPDDRKLRIDESTVVLFAFPSKVIDWAGQASINHTPSVSAVSLALPGRSPIRTCEQLRNGLTLCVQRHYENYEGRVRLEAVLEDTAIMSSILLRLPDDLWARPTPSGVPQVVATRMTALLGGVVSNKDGCLRIGEHLLVFPKDQHEVTVKGNTVDVADLVEGTKVVWRVGDSVAVGGGTVPDPRIIPHQPFPDHCNGPFWLVGTVA